MGHVRGTIFDCLLAVMPAYMHMAGTPLGSAFAGDNCRLWLMPMCHRGFGRSVHLPYAFNSMHILIQ